MLTQPPVGLMASHEQKLDATLLHCCALTAKDRHWRPLLFLSLRKSRIPRIHRGNDCCCAAHEEEGTDGKELLPLPHSLVWQHFGSFMVWFGLVNLLPVQSQWLL